MSIQSLEKEITSVTDELKAEFHETFADDSKWEMVYPWVRDDGDTVDIRSTDHRFSVYVADCDVAIRVGHVYLIKEDLYVEKPKWLFLKRRGLKPSKIKDRALYLKSILLEKQKEKELREHLDFLKKKATSDE